MSLVKWTPRRGILPAFNHVDRLLDGFFRPNGFGANLLNVDWLPAFDVVETDKEYAVRVEAPGMDKSDFHVALKDGVLTVTGEKKLEKSKEGERYAHRESCFGRFSRSFRLPDEVAESKIKADYKNGVLTVTVPRLKPIETKEIEVTIS